MCVLAFAYDAHPRWRLALIGNRDELHARPSAPLARWEDRPGVIAGRDLASGGSWLGVSDAGRLAVVTNRRDPLPPSPDKTSRGALVADQLAADGLYADPAVETLTDFNAFNLIVATSGGARFLTNRPAPHIGPLGPGLHGMSNGALDAQWAKVDRIKARLADWLDTGDGRAAPLLDALQADAGSVAGPDDVPAGPIFILNPVYGTRCSTVVLIDDAGKGLIAERRFGAAGETTGETEIAFDWGV